MRGDSIRDLYAKTLAVVGLAMLALAGAVVDYWPMGGALPALPARVMHARRDPMLTRDLSAVLVAVNTTVAVPTLRTPRRPMIALTRTIAHAFSPVVNVDVEIPVPALTEAVRSSAVDDLIDTDHGMSAVASSLVYVDLSMTPEPPPLMGMMGTGSSDPSDDSHRLIPTALKRTKESLKDARLFLGDKFQGVVGALRRASPFFSTAPVAPF